MRKKNDNKDKIMSNIFTLTPPTSVKMIKVPELQLPVRLEGHNIINFENDTGAADNFLARQLGVNWESPKNLLSNSNQQVNTNYPS